jgi:hypothetical protein
MHGTMNVKNNILTLSGIEFLSPSHNISHIVRVTLIQSSFRFLKQNFVFVSYFLYTDNKL